MSNDYIPTKDADLMVYANSFDGRTTADPALYGLVAGDAAQIHAAAQDFATKLALASDPGTRTEAAIASKDTAKVLLTALLRGYAMLIKSNRAVSDEAKINLGIGVYDTVRSRVLAPATFPVIQILGATPRQHELRFTDSGDADKKGKPAGAQGLQLFCHVGEGSAGAPADPLASRFQSLVTRSTMRMTFAPADVSKTAYYYARWYTASGLTGPWSLVASMTVAG